MDSGHNLLHYRILNRLGEGGMGVVYRAEDTRMGRTVALKVLRAELAADEEWNRRFEREERAASTFSHPGIATLYDFQRDGTNSFYTMEFVEGRNLREILKKQGPLPLAQLTGCGLQVAEALAEAHRKGVVHRDLKPENVMESASGYYKILDFGLARFTAGELTAPGTGSRLETIPRDTTQAGKIVGTVSYMSPEQAQGVSVDARSDVFSFGSLFYELATGEPPFKRNNAISTFHAIVHEDPRPLREVCPDAPPDLERILTRCLDKDPARRYQKAAELADDLRLLHSGTESGSGSISAIRGYPGSRVARSWQTWGVSSRRWAVATWIGLALIAGVIVGQLWLSGPDGEGVGESARLGEGAAPSSPVMLRPPGDAARDEEPRSPTGLGPAGGRGAGGAGGDASELARSGQRSIAVSPFVNNTGDADSAWLTQGVPEMITTALAGSGSLSVISTQRLSDLNAMAGRDGRSGMDGATATELARWAGATMVINGSIYRMGGEYRIDAQAYDTATGQVLAATRAQGKDVFDLVDRITDELKARLLDLEAPPPQIAQGLVPPTQPKAAPTPQGGAEAGATTDGLPTSPGGTAPGRVTSAPSLTGEGLDTGRRASVAIPASTTRRATTSEAAFRHYVDGVNYYKDLRFKEGADAFRKALDADPSYITAQMHLGMSLLMNGDAKSGLAWIDKAGRRIDRLPEKERRVYRIIEQGYVKKDSEAAFKEAEAYTAAFPEDQEGPFWFAKGQADVEGDRFGAIRILHGVLRQEPDNLPAAAALSHQIAAMGSVDEAVKILEDYRTRHPRASAPIDRIIDECRSGEHANPDLDPTR